MSAEVLLSPHKCSFLYQEVDTIKRSNEKYPICPYTTKDLLYKSCFVAINATTYALTSTPHLSEHPPYVSAMIVTSDVTLRIIMPTAGMKEMLTNLSIMFKQKKTTYEKCSLPLKVALSLIFAYSIGTPSLYVESKYNVLPTILIGFGFTNPVMDFIDLLEATAQKKASSRLHRIVKRKEEMIAALENFQFILNKFRDKINIDELNEISSLELLKKFIILGERQPKPTSTKFSKFITWLSRLIGVGLTFFPVATGCVKTKNALLSSGLPRSIDPILIIIQGVLNTCIQLTLVPNGIADLASYLFRMNSPHSKIAMATTLFPKMTLVTSSVGYLISAVAWSYIYNQSSDDEKMLEDVFGPLVYRITKYVNPIMNSMLTVPFIQNLMAELSLTLGRCFGNPEDKKIVSLLFMVEMTKKIIQKATIPEIEIFCDLLDQIDEEGSTPSVREIASKIGTPSEIIDPSPLARIEASPSGEFIGHQEIEDDQTMVWRSLTPTEEKETQTLDEE